MVEARYYTRENIGNRVMRRANYFLRMVEAGYYTRENVGSRAVRRVNIFRMVAARYCTCENIETTHKYFFANGRGAFLHPWKYQEPRHVVYK